MINLQLLNLLRNGLHVNKTLFHLLSYIL